MTIRCCYIDVGASAEADVVVANNTMFFVSCYFQRTFAVEDQLTFTKEGTLLVLIIRRVVAAAIYQTVAGAISQSNKHAFATLYIDGCPRRVGQRYPIQSKVKLFLAIYLEIPIGTASL